MPDHDTGTLLGLTANIVAAHLSYNQVTTKALPSLIQSVYRSLSTVAEPEAEPTITHIPAVPVKKSVFPDFIVCLEVVQQVFRIIADIRKRGTTVLLVEQNAHMALSVADRGYVLETGSLLVSGKPDELWGNPDVRAAYLGGRVAQ